MTQRKDGGGKLRVLQASHLLSLKNTPKHRADGKLHFRPEEMVDAALAYRAAGLSFIRLDKDGSPRLPVPNEYGEDALRWGIYRKRPPSKKECREWFSWEGFYELPGLAILCGQVSGGLELISIDNADTFKTFYRRLAATNWGRRAIEKIVWVRTPGSEVHGYYRCSNSKRSQVLARREGPLDERRRPNFAALIETEGEGGYVLAPPSTEKFFKPGMRHQYMTDRDLTMVGELAPRERDSLHDLARQMDECPSPPRLPSSAYPYLLEAYDYQMEHIIDSFDRKATWEQILVPAGWESLGRGRWRRPGRKHGVSATTDDLGMDLLVLRSAFAPPFGARSVYTKFQAFALLYHNGSGPTAARSLQRCRHKWDV